MFFSSPASGRLHDRYSSLECSDNLILYRKIELIVTEVLINFFIDTATATFRFCLFV